MYKVTHFFYDLQDSHTTKDGTVYHAYNVGDTYPRDGYKPSDERIKELSGRDNIRGIPVIEEQEKPVEEQEKPEKSNKRKAKAEEAADAPEKKAE